jgi:uncharacterized repeat protein (TIGR03803 family)
MPRSLDIFRKFALGCGLVLAVVASFGAAHADSAKVLYAFKGGADGAGPIAGVTSDSQGNLYGTTWEGGGSGCGGKGCGTVFKLAPDGTETVLCAFQGGSDGADAYAGVISDSLGNLYGTTLEGGGSGCGGYGCGTVFKIAPDGAETVLYVFQGGTDGSYPQAGLLRDNRGNLYGTTQYDGAHNGGTVFRIAPDGTESVIYAFCSQTNCTDGETPQSALIADKEGNLYGTTVYGGSSEGGTVFQIAPGSTETVLYSFCQVQPNCKDGWQPLAGVTRDKAGNLYGTTSGGGEDGISGIVFKLAPDGTETVLHNFNHYTDGYVPVSGVIIDKAGDLYGTLLHNVCHHGAEGLGLVYRLSPDGSEKLRCVPAASEAGVMERNGTLYGTGVFSYRYPSGVVFAIEKD